MGKYRRVMLNTNIFCRPFDDLKDPIIKNESIFAEKIFDLAENKKVEIFTSDILYAELNLISDQRKRDIIFNEIETISQKRINISDEVHDLAAELTDFVGDYSDSLHIAFAAISGCDCLISCDKQLIKNRIKIESFLISKDLELAILTPEEFIKSFD
ncbi:PIN domain-containing protein [Candidatus Woesearchaeota archaeon]|nr:PIN domain-containing protein [Candidatus Woesearchaeota archaeon]